MYKEVLERISGIGLYGVASICIGGGEGLAVMIEAV